MEFLYSLILNLKTVFEKINFYIFLYEFQFSKDTKNNLNNYIKKKLFFLLFPINK